VVRFLTNQTWYRDDLTTTRQWPEVVDVMEYRKRVQASINRLVINEMRLENNSEILQSSPFWIIIMGVEHEKIHLETSTVLIR